MREGLDFLCRFLRQPRAIGAVWPSSRGLARKMAAAIPWQQVSSVVEYGPGTGIFTHEYTSRMQPGTRVIAIERDRDMATRLRLRFPDITVCHGDVADVANICSSQGLRRVDAIISGLPWALFGPDMQRRILDVSVATLNDGGTFATFAYLQGLLLPAGWRFRGELKQRFSDVRTSSIEWFNLPPAFVYRCRS
jgi:phospholipid N-methyltransferase